MRNNFVLSPHFNLQEFDSPDTGEVMLESELVDRLERLRTLVGKEIYVVSGYRTPEHNRFVGGQANSFHLRGMASDITWRGIEMKRGVALAERAGFNGIGQYPDKYSLHVDVRGYRARWIKVAGRFV